MTDQTEREEAGLRRHLAAISVIGISLAVAIYGCGKKSEAPAPGPAASPGAATSTSAPSAAEDAPSFHATAEAGAKPYAAARAPFDGAIDPSGRLWVLDSANGHVWAFDAAGASFGGWGGSVDKGQYSLRGPEGVGITNDRIFIADTWSGAIRAFSLKGEPVARVDGLYGPRGLAARDGTVWVTDTGNSRVLVYDADLKNPRVIGKEGSGPGDFKGPVGIGIAPGGRVYVGDSANGRIQVLDKEGKTVATWNLPWLKQSWQAHVAVDEHGRVFVSHPDTGEVVLLGKDGRSEQTWQKDDAGTKLVRPIGLVPDSKLNVLYVMDTGTQSVVKIALKPTGSR